MPCYTRISVEVKDRQAAEDALKQMGVKATIEKNINGTFSVYPEKQTNTFKDDFLMEYSVVIATNKAKKEGWQVNRKWNKETGEVEVTLRQYNDFGRGY